MTSLDYLLPFTSLSRKGSEHAGRSSGHFMVERTIRNVINHLSPFSRFFSLLYFENGSEATIRLLMVDRWSDNFIEHRFSYSGPYGGCWPLNYYKTHRKQFWSLGGVGDLNMTTLYDGFTLIFSGHTMLVYVHAWNRCQEVNNILTTHIRIRHVDETLMASNGLWYVDAKGALLAVWALTKINKQINMANWRLHQGEKWPYRWYEWNQAGHIRSTTLILVDSFKSFCSSGAGSSFFRSSHADVHCGNAVYKLAGYWSCNRIRDVSKCYTKPGASSHASTIHHKRHHDEAPSTPVIFHTILTSAYAKFSHTGLLPAIKVATENIKTVISIHLRITLKTHKQKHKHNYLT